MATGSNQTFRPAADFAAVRGLCGMQLRVLPDFLLDHSLLQPEAEQRLPEICARWTQFVRRLASWGSDTLFCLRMDGQPERGAVNLHLLARPPEPHRRDELQRDLEFALRAYGIIGEEVDYTRYLPFLSEARIGALDLDEGRRAALRVEINRSFDRAFAAPPETAAFLGVTQDVSRSLWNSQVVLSQILGDPRIRKEAPKGHAGLPGSWLPLGWEGPHGPFVLPFRALLASPGPIRISIYLQPCVVESESEPWLERLWLDKLALNAQPKERAADPVAALASGRAGAAARRLLGDCFMVAVEVVSPNGDEAAARQVAEVMRALCLEMPTDVAREDEPLPGARIAALPSGMAASAREGHARLGFPRWMDHSGLPHYIARLPYLADARGAATLFRLPVSIRSGVPGIEVAQPAPDFNPGPRSEAAGSGARPLYRPAGARRRIVIGRFEAAGTASIPLDDLTKHTLVTGSTGSGKTKTVLHLLHQIWADHGVPFLVIESAKAEYRGLIGMEAFRDKPGEPGLAIFTLGNEATSPLRLNPFEILRGVRVEAHVGKLQTCFEAAFPPVGPLSSIIEQSLIEVYSDQGWMMTDTLVDGPDGRRFPTMSDFGDKLNEVGLSRGYEGEYKATLKAAITGRIKPLTRTMRGSKGRMLDTQRCSPDADRLFGGPAVIEMNDLNEQDKALVSMFLLTFLREHREQQFHRETSAGGNRLRHVTVIEEAHNVLAKVPSTGGQEGGGADTRYRAVQAFCAMLAEIRSYGEGIVIADQSPEKLAADAMRNTNLQIAHQLRDTDDRDAIANAMMMTDEQRDFLGRLQVGQAGVFYTGLQRASFVRVPQFDDPAGGGRGSGFRPVVSEDEVRAHTAPISGPIRELDRPYDGCQHCGHFETCDYRPPVYTLLGEEAIHKRFVGACSGKPSVEVIMRELSPLLREVTARLGVPGSSDAAWCAMQHMRHRWLKTWTSGTFDNSARKWFEHTALPLLEPRSESDSSG